VPDPVAAATGSTYPYVDDRPTVALDPSGLCWWGWRCARDELESAGDAFWSGTGTLASRITNATVTAAKWGWQNKWCIATTVAVAALTEGVGGVLFAGGEVGVGAGEAVTIFRTVGAGEAADIAASGAYRTVPGLEGKYFYATRTQAEKLAKLYEERGWGGPQSVTSGTVPRTIFRSAHVFHDAGLGRAYYFPKGLLGQIRNITNHGPVP
jgi:hypothetical protein